MAPFISLLTITWLFPILKLPPQAIRWATTRLFSSFKSPPQLISPVSIVMPIIFRFCGTLPSAPISLSPVRLAVLSPPFSSNVCFLPLVTE